MKKYILDVTETEKEHAGSKAKTDISYFLHDLGYLRIYLDKDMGRLEKYLFANQTLNRKLSTLTSGDILVVQYPTYIGRLYMKILMQKIKKKHVQTILVIHDLVTLREDERDEKKISHEISWLNGFDIIISHNQKMTEWLQKKGLLSKTINLGVFDYLTHNERREKTDQERQIAFAGNLNKSQFFAKFNKIKTKVNLFGPNPDKKNSSGTIAYKGSFSPDELPAYLKGSYGLVWDGDSLQTCNGKYGNYLRYNNPHKVSLYISSDLPVIIWKEAALAPFIKDNHLGITIESLDRMDQELDRVTKEEYGNMLQAVSAMGKRIRSGYFIKTAMNRAERILCNVNVDNEG